ncbi:uncharacterized protein LOC135168239 [Diachasmimorpha longicaudata]|uniref:uncharacterized protein LOC135168239 n=1 Tax=Diachasmimorpha longicaudata TaxID=58733 RepID=UPI0030B86A8B
MKITWEHYMNKRRITQCRRCQEWGHSTTNCVAKPLCLKCAENHLTRECTKTRDTPATCANCGGKHPANATSCEAYKRRIELIEKKKTPLGTKRKLSQNPLDINNTVHFPKLGTPRKEERRNYNQHEQQSTDLLKDKRGKNYWYQRSRGQSPDERNNRDENLPHELYLTTADEKLPDRNQKTNDIILNYGEHPIQSNNVSANKS